MLQCDVTEDESIQACFQTIQQQYGVIHGIVDCIAFANEED